MSAGRPVGTVRFGSATPPADGLRSTSRRGLASVARPGRGQEDSASVFVRNRELDRQQCAGRVTVGEPCQTGALCDDVFGFLEGVPLPFGQVLDGSQRGFRSLWAGPPEMSPAGVEPAVGAGLRNQVAADIHFPGYDQLGGQPADGSLHAVGLLRSDAVLRLRFGPEVGQQGALVGQVTDHKDDANHAS